MFPLPPGCSGCHQSFDARDPRRRLVILEDRYALCSECEWRAIHPEARVDSRRARRFRSVTPVPAR